MDKSDLLEEWDVVYVTETESAESETKNKETEKENDDNDSQIEESEDKSTGSDITIEERVKEDIASEAKADVEIVTSKGDSIVNISTNTASVSADTEREEVAEPESQTCQEPEQDIVDEPDNKIEVVSNVDSEPERNILDSSECSIEPEFETILTVEPESIRATSEPEDVVVPSPQYDIAAQSDNNIVTEDIDLKTEISSDSFTEAKANVDINQDTAELNTDDDNIVEDIVHVEKPVNSNLDSSLLTSDIGSEEFDSQDSPELVPDRIQIEQEMAAIESSSSDIDIIDENIEESITSSFISPLSLSISSSVADASSISFISSSVESLSIKPKEPFQSTPQEKEFHKSESTERKRSKRDVPPHSQDKSENVRSRRRESQRTTPQRRRSFFDWFFLLIELLRNLSGYDWCMIGGIAASIYLTVVVNQTNIFAVVQKENVVSQMKDMMNELKNDNKMIKDQMLSELNNKKAISSFEHQIRELRKENSKLSHMLYDVAKVLDKQKYSYEKKESEYLAPFKKEINQLKEHINILKFDNEELQKELVRMRYGSYAQGSDSDTTKIRDQPGKKGSARSEEDSEDIPQDFESLKKWNELITLLTQELGSIVGTEGSNSDKSHSDTNSKKPFWKAVFTDFKGTFNDLRKINLTALFSDYQKANQRAMSNIYKSVKDFFTITEQAKQYTSRDNSLQWKNIGDFVSDLKEKWTNIKDRLYTTDLKQFFEEISGRSSSTKSSSHKTEGVDSSTSDVPLKQQEKQPDPADVTDETKWMFNRAAHREELRNVPPEGEEEVNWYLKKGKHQPDQEKGKRRF